jgi:hypothetical protein
VSLARFEAAGDFDAIGDLMLAPDPPVDDRVSEEAVVFIGRESDFIPVLPKAELELDEIDLPGAATEAARRPLDEPETTAASVATRLRGRFDTAVPGVFADIPLVLCEVVDLFTRDLVDKALVVAMAVTGADL